jgi:hypothetical protein
LELRVVTRHEQSRPPAALEGLKRRQSFMRQRRDMALSAVLALYVATKNLGSGRWAAVTSDAVFAHKDAMWNHRGRAGIEAVSSGKVLRQAGEVVFAKQLVLPVEGVALLAVSSTADARRFGMGIGGGEAERRGLFAGGRMALGAGDIKGRVRNDRRGAVVHAALRADQRRCDRQRSLPSRGGKVIAASEGKRREY